MLWAAIFPSINLANDPAREVIGRGVEQYVRAGRRTPQRRALPAPGPLRRSVSESTMRRAQRGPRDHAGDGRHVQQRAARDGARRRRRSSSPAFATFGTAASATDWWLGADDDSPRRMPPDEFVAHLTTIMVGAINGTGELLGIKIDADQPHPHRGPPATTRRLTI